MHVKVTNGTAEIYTIGKLRKENPSVSFPKIIPNSILAEYSVYPVTQLDQPNYDSSTHKIEERDVELVNGVWTKGWNAVALSVDETATQLADKKANVRAERDDKLRETDYLGLSDATMSTEMAAYRQALRDVPQQTDFPGTINWPTKP